MTDFEGKFFSKNTIRKTFRITPFVKNDRGHKVKGKINIFQKIFIGILGVFGAPLPVMDMISLERRWA